MSKAPELVVIYEGSQIPGLLAYRTAHPNTEVVCLDFWVERELTKRNIPYLSLRDFMPAEETEEEWWLLAQEVAREWYRLPEMAFFEHGDIRIGEALEPMAEMYLSLLFYFARLCQALKSAYPERPVHVLSPRVGIFERAGPLASFERRSPADAATLVGLHLTNEAPAISPVALFPRRFAASLLIVLYNGLLRFIPKKPLKIYASEYWSHIAPVLKEMPNAELVLMESSELRNIPWRILLGHRIRIRHPLDVRSARSTDAAKGFAPEWEAAAPAVAGYLKGKRGDLDWQPVLRALAFLVAYAPRIIADYEGFLAILRQERPDIIVERASIGGRQHHFFLLARAARALGIPSVELQHAGAIFDQRSVHSHLETTYLAAYGELEREEHAKNGYAPERIIPVGSPRFDHYGQNAGQERMLRENILAQLGFKSNRPVVTVAVPTQKPGLSIVLFSSYEIADLFQHVREADRILSGVQWIFKFREPPSAAEQAYVRELFPKGNSAAVYGSLYPYLCASDIATSGNSTVLYEVMVSHRPLILFPWKKNDGYLALYGAAAPIARDGRELAFHIEKLLSDKLYRETAVRSEEAFVRRHRFDGRSAERVAALLRDHST